MYRFLGAWYLGHAHHTHNMILHKIRMMLDIQIKVPDCQLAHTKIGAIIFVNASGVKSDIYDCLVFLIDRY